MQLQCICTFVYKNYLLAQFIHLREVPDGCASQGGRVLHKNHLAFVFLHTDNLPVQGPGPDVMERHLDVFPRCRQAGDCVYTAVAGAETWTHCDRSLQNLTLQLTTRWNYASGGVRFLGHLGSALTLFF